MDLSAAVREPRVIAPVGGRTQWHVGGPPPGDAAEVRAPAGVIRYEPADMTVTVGAGTTFADLDALLAERGQECALDPRDPSATIGGILACGLSGIRRLRCGPVRDNVLEVRVVLADGRLIKGGGPTVKNVTGYDLPRLFVGSFGTLGVIAEVTLRCRPRPVCSRWFAFESSAALYRPTARLWRGGEECVLLEGTEADVVAQAAGARPIDAPPALPEGPHRGRISIAPGQIAALASALGDNARWYAELGVGTVHVACDDVDGFVAARRIAIANGGWMLREQGGPIDDDGFGVPLPNVEIMKRLKQAFDPDGKCNPGRLPL